MLEVIKEIFSSVYIGIVVATVFFIVANIIGGVLLANREGKFEWKILGESLIRYAGILFVAILLYVGGYFGDEALNEYVTDVMNIKNLVSMGIAYYAAERLYDAAKTFLELLDLKKVDGFDDDQHVKKIMGEDLNA